MNSKRCLALVVALAVLCALTLAGLLFVCEDSRVSSCNR